MIPGTASPAATEQAGKSLDVTRCLRTASWLSDTGEYCAVLCRIQGSPTVSILGLSNQIQILNQGDRKENCVTPQQYATFGYHSVKI